MDGTAIILSGGLFETPSAKTTHGLIRGTERYKIIGVIDAAIAGRDAGEVLDQQARNIFAYTTVQAYLDAGNPKPDFCIVGIANSGGTLPTQLLPVIREALEAGISIVSGLHQFLDEIPGLADLAKEKGVQLIDVRKPKPRAALHFWSGDIRKVTCPKIAVMGVDCGIGKRTTARFLTQAARTAGLKAEMIYTGQTGWLQGGRYGFVLDSTLNDFVSGELEHAIVSCYEAEQPDVIFIEGQAALRNPSGPCGSEFLVSGQADGVILQYAPDRRFFKGWEHVDAKMVSPQSEIALIRAYGVETIAVTLNTKGLSDEEARSFQAQYEAELGIPVVLPVEEGVASLIDVIRKRFL